MDRISEFVKGVVEYSDPVLSEHHHRLSSYGHNFATHLGYSKADIHLFKIACEIHDIGKLAIPENLLNKPSTLTRAERSVIEQHTTIGRDLIQPLALNSKINDTVLSHHENFDGTGYPQKIGRHEIPTFARMMRICDSFDALTMRAGPH